MKNYTREDIMEMAANEDVGFIRLQFTDIFGTMKNIAITEKQLVKAMDNHCMFDGASIEGFLNMEDTEMCLHPDLNTFEIFPWRPQQGKVARFLCDICRPDGTPFEGDSRFILKRTIKEAEEMGYIFKAGPECEFFLFHTDEDGLPTTITHEKAGYFDVGPLDLGENARRDIVLTLEDMGFEIETSHHESAPAQHGIDFKYEEALTAADNIMTFKMVVKTIAKRHGLHAAFMPKPQNEVNGSGMHLNMSLEKNGTNIFSDKEDDLGLSKEAYYFIGGIMSHIKAISFITNPIVNSYKRLITGFFAPVDIIWSTKISQSLIHVPSFRGERGENTRIELRSPDPSANPYLALSVCLAAGLEGIRKKVMPPKSVNQKFYNMIHEDKRNQLIERLPSNLLEAIEEFKKDRFIREVLGKDISEKLINVKMEEYNKYISQVTPWELDEYLYKI